MERCEQELWLRTTIAETLERQALQGCSTDHTIGLPEPTPVDVSALGLAGLGGETFGGDGQAATIPPSDTATRESLRDITDDVDLGPELTQGGMGLLRVAYQRALQREVVVKTLLPRRCTPQTQAALLREARLAGRLEHPNTIPIYTVGWRRGEGPALVMKRIEGTPWSEYLDADARAGMLLHPAVLERHLNRLITVCHAVDFAHSRGVIHRDIKPENVMLGSFGEVYLLDWGVAVDMESLADEPEDLIVGTPVFMAPEQVRSDERPSLRTDVYLLGATLHQILTGQHRHAGDELVTVLVAAHLSKPHTYGPEVPDVLAKIANRACHREPEARFETVGAMRQALLTYLNNRPSVVAAQMALQELEQLEEAIDRVQQEDKGQGLEEINRRFSACRTGFEQALQGWPDNEAAQSGLQRCLEVMIRYEVWMGNAGSASLLFTDLRSPNLELKAIIEALRQEIDGQRSAHELLEQVRSDRRIHGEGWGRTISVVYSGSVAVMMFSGWSYGMRLGWIEMTPWLNLGAMLGATLVSTVSTWVMRRWVFDTQVYIRMMVVFVALHVILCFNRLLGLMLWLGWQELLIADCIALVTGAVVVAATITRAYWGVVVLSMIATLLVLNLPDYAFDIIGVTYLVSNLYLGWLMRPGGSGIKGPFFSERLFEGE